MCHLPHLGYTVGTPACLRCPRHLTGVISDGKDSMDSSRDPDGALFSRMAGGDSAAFDELYGRYAPVAEVLARGILREPGLAEDAVQEAFLAVWRRAPSYDPARGSVCSWLLTIVRHRAIDDLRRRGAERWVVAGGAAVAEASDGSDTHALACRRAEARVVRAALGRLPAAQRGSLALAYEAGYSHAQIACAQGVPPSTVKSRVRLGLSALRRHLAGQEGMGMW